MNERTSKRVSAIAGRVLELKLSADDKADFEIRYGFSWASIRALAASCLVQTEDWRYRRGGKRPRTSKGGHVE